ncbi:MAG: BMC domain-containing protein [Eubacteriales bacterium]|nr:BMC domain-containing protein [Eubacteriales bacterium]
MTIHVMKTVSEGTKQIIKRRARMEGLDVLFSEHSALALINGNVSDLIYASDLAQKASTVEVFEISGNCPQHMTCLAILGDAAAVDEAVKRIESEKW